jgi:hypothetical protein
MKEIWVMICSGLMLDKCLAASRDEASEIFKSRSRYEDWSESDILSEADYFLELELYYLENQTNE